MDALSEDRRTSTNARLDVVQLESTPGTPGAVIQHRGYQE